MEAVVDHETVLLDPASGRYFGLEGAGTQIWRRLSLGPATLADLIEAVTAEYAIDVETASRDVASFVDGLLKEGLVTEA